MSNPKYTFLLPAYKAKYFEEALRSIKAQTLRDFRVLVSDDCSPEPLKPIFDRVCGDDPRFTFRRNTENMGSKSLVSHWNLLVDMCETEWLIMASDDDVYEPEFLEKMDELQNKYPQVDLLHGRVREINERGETNKTDAEYENLVPMIDFMQFRSMKGHIECLANHAYRTSRLQEHHGFVEFPLAWHSDIATNNYMALNGCATTSQIVFSFRMSGKNISSQFGNPQVSRKKVIATYAFDRWMQDFTEHALKILKLSSEEKNVIVTEYKSIVRNNTESFIYHCRPLDFIKYLCQLPDGLHLCRLRMLAHYVNGRIKLQSC